MLCPYRAKSGQLPAGGLIYGAGSRWNWRITDELSRHKRRGALAPAKDAGRFLFLGERSAQVIRRSQRAQHAVPLPSKERAVASGRFDLWGREPMELADYG